MVVIGPQGIKKKKKRINLKDQPQPLGPIL
jgi:hypothetical protein